MSSSSSSLRALSRCRCIAAHTAARPPPTYNAVIHHLRRSYSSSSSTTSSKPTLPQLEPASIFNLPSVRLNTLDSLDSDALADIIDLIDDAILAAPNAVYQVQSSLHSLALVQEALESRFFLFTGQLDVFFTPSAIRVTQMRNNLKHSRRIQLPPAGPLLTTGSAACAYDWVKYTSSPDTIDPSDSMIYLRDHITADAALSELHASFAPGGAALDAPVLGFDMEWRPIYKHGSEPNPVALVQLATRDRIWLIHVSSMSCFPAGLTQILEDEHILKCGVGIFGDALKLFRDHRVQMRGCVELSYYARTIEPDVWPPPPPPPTPESSSKSAPAVQQLTESTAEEEPEFKIQAEAKNEVEDEIKSENENENENETEEAVPTAASEPTKTRKVWPRMQLISLARLVLHYTNTTLPKGNVRLSNWEARFLTLTQRNYAANDAHSALTVYKQLRKAELKSNVGRLRKKGVRHYRDCYTFNTRDEMSVFTNTYDAEGKEKALRGWLPIDPYLSGGLGELRPDSSSHSATRTPSWKRRETAFSESESISRNEMRSTGDILANMRRVLDSIKLESTQSTENASEGEGNSCMAADDRETGETNEFEGIRVGPIRSGGGGLRGSATASASVLAGTAGNSESGLAQAGSTRTYGTYTPQRRRRLTESSSASVWSCPF